MVVSTFKPRPFRSCDNTNYIILEIHEFLILQLDSKEISRIKLCRIMPEGFWHALTISVPVHSTSKFPFHACSQCVWTWFLYRSNSVTMESNNFQLILKWKGLIFHNGPIFLLCYLFYLTWLNMCPVDTLLLLLLVQAKNQDSSVSIVTG